jgi:hypothetical protein
MPFADGTFDVFVSSLMLHHAGGSAARHLSARGLRSVERSGRLMACSARLPLACSTRGCLDG